MTTATAQRNVVRFTPKPKASLVNVTPKDAAKWLDSNGKNRTVREATVAAYARDMTNEDWQITGDAIKFALDGTLLDGQHRLWAVVQSGATVQMFVIRGLAPDAQEVMDSGVKRTASDALALRDYKHTNLLASTSRLALTIDTQGYSGVIGKQSAFTTTEVTQFVADHPELPSYMQMGTTAARQMDASPTAVCYAMWRLYRIDPDMADAFFAAAAEGIGLKAGDPALALRRRLAEARRHREVVSMAATLSMLFRAWNATREGKQLHRLQVVNRHGEVTIPDPS